MERALHCIEAPWIWLKALTHRSPLHCRFVFLSATIPNAREFAEWIAKIHRCAVHAVCAVPSALGLASPARQGSSGCQRCPVVLRCASSFSHLQVALSRGIHRLPAHPLGALCLPCWGRRPLPGGGPQEQLPVRERLLPGREHDFVSCTPTSVSMALPGGRPQEQLPVSTSVTQTLGTAADNYDQARLTRPRNPMRPAGPAVFHSYKPSAIILPSPPPTMPAGMTTSRRRWRR